jgi:hypothetical protein
MTITKANNNNTPKYKGVKYSKKENKWYAQRQLNKVLVKTKLVKTAKEAYQLYQNLFETKTIDVKKNTEKRKKFPQVFRNTICCRQEWKCNCCKKLLPSEIIVDHMVPLFLNGSNDMNNLQAICSSCDKFKTSFLDYKILKPLSDKILLTKDIVYNSMIEQYNKTIGLKCNNIQPSNNNIQPSNNNIQPSNNNIQPSNNNIQPSNNNILNSNILANILNNIPNDKIGNIEIKIGDIKLNISK